MMDDIRKGLIKTMERAQDRHQDNINNNFQQTPEFWECPQCRKISYGLLKGTYTYGDGFKIDKHLQQLFLKGFYSLFPVYQPSNKGLSKAQVKKKERLQNCWRFIFLNTCYAIREQQEAISLSLDKAHYNRNGKYYCRYWKNVDLQEVVEAAEKKDYYVKYKGRKGKVSFITRLKITDKFKTLISGYVIESKTDLPDLPEGFTDHDMILEFPLPRPERPPVIIKEREGVYRIPEKSNNEVHYMCKRVEQYNEFMQKQEIIINGGLGKCKKRHLEELIHSLYRNEIEILKKNNNNISNKQQTTTKKKHTNNTTHTTPPTNDPVINSVLCNDCHDIFTQNVAFRFTGYSCQRIFTERMQNGGRFYGIVVQKLPKEIREQTIINGESVVELDFSALHPSLLYSKIGVQPPPDIYVYNKGVGGQARYLIKLICLVGFNAGSEKEAINAVRQEYNEKYGVMLHNADINPFIELFFDHNPELKQFFGKGMGTELQYIDSQIMDNILKELRKKNIPAIPVHDSCVVPVSAQEIVRDVMVKAYQKITKTNHIPFITQ